MFDIDISVDGRSLLWVSLTVAVFSLLISYYWSRGKEEIKKKPESVNYHFTRQCNYECGFCFHTAKTSFVLPISEAKLGLQMLKSAGNYTCINYKYWSL